MHLKTIAFVSTPILAAALMNALIYFRKWNEPLAAAERNPFLPPGWFIGLLWTLLLGILGYATFVAWDAQDRVITSLLVVLMLSCIMYPVYTKLQPKLGLVANVATLILAFVVTIVATFRLPKTIIYLVPLLIWASYVNIVEALYCSSSTFRKK